MRNIPSSKTKASSGQERTQVMHPEHSHDACIDVPQSATVNGTVITGMIGRSPQYLSRRIFIASKTTAALPFL